MKDQHNVVFRFVNLILGDWSGTLWEALDWEVKEGEVWAVVGPNGSGKSLLCQTILGRVPMKSGEMITRIRSEAWAWISFESQEQLIFSEKRHDDTDFLDGTIDPGTLLGDFAGPLALPWLEKLGIEDRIGRGMKFLSSGEIRKAFLAKALAEPQTAILLDEPYEALDADSRKIVERIIEDLAESGRVFIFLSQEPDSLPASITHALVLDDRRIVASGGIAEVKSHPVWNRLLTSKASQPTEFEAPQQPGNKETFQKIIEMRNVDVRYGEKTVFHGLDWTVRPGEVWTILGPNGSGKSTLLSLICADHPQAYRNEIVLFDRLFGTGQSIWDIKSRLGLVSYALQLQHNDHLDESVLAVVCSGFHDSIGLYTQPGWDQVAAARRWLRFLGMADLASSRFGEISFGLQRMVLLARAMIKNPDLVILDEPCQGLDAPHKRRILECVDKIGEAGFSTILCVTHRWEERLASSRKLLRFHPHPEGSTVTVEDI